MKLVRFMDAAYQGKASGRRLKTRQGDMIFSLEDLADRVGEKPTRAEVEQFVPQDKNQLDLLISAHPGKKYALLWGYLTSFAAECRTAPLILPCRDYAFRNIRAGYGVVRGDCGKFAGLGNCGGRIVVQGSCGERAGWLMRAGSLHVRGDVGDYLGLLMSGGKIRVLGKAAKRAGWRKKGGSIRAASYGSEAADDLLGLD